MEPSEAYEVIHYIPAASLPYSQPGSCYTLVRLPDDDPTAGKKTWNMIGLIGVVTGKTTENILQYKIKDTLLMSHLSTVSCTFSCTMKYLVRDCDPNTGEPDDDGYDDEYVVRDHRRFNCVIISSFLCIQLLFVLFKKKCLSCPLVQLEDLEVTVADHIQKVLKPNFGAAWEEVGDENEKEETFALASVRTLDGTHSSYLDIYLRLRFLSDSFL